jgi:hypothetical protein
LNRTNLMLRFDTRKRFLEFFYTVWCGENVDFELQLRRFRKALERVK